MITQQQMICSLLKALCEAIELKQDTIIHSLLAIPEVIDNAYMEPLQVAAKLGRSDIIDKLLENENVRVNAHYNNNKALNEANYNCEITKRLLSLDNVISMACKQTYNLNILFNAIKNNHSEIVEMYLNHPEFANMSSVVGNQLLCFATANATIDMVNQLLDNQHMMDYVNSKTDQIVRTNGFLYNNSNIKLNFENFERLFTIPAVSNYIRNNPSIVLQLINQSVIFSPQIISHLLNIDTIFNELNELVINFKMRGKHRYDALDFRFFMSAIWSDNVELAKQLLKYPDFVLNLSCNANYYFHMAFKTGSLDVISEMLKIKDSEVHAHWLNDFPVNALLDYFGKAPLSPSTLLAQADEITLIDAVKSVLHSVSRKHPLIIENDLKEGSDNKPFKPVEQVAHILETMLEICNSRQVDIYSHLSTEEKNILEAYDPGIKDSVYLEIDDLIALSEQTEYLPSYQSGILDPVSNQSNPEHNGLPSCSSSETIKGSLSCTSISVK